MFDHEMREVAERVLHACRQRKLRVVTAESCTGGLIAATLTAIAGSSDVVDRAFITYSNEAKREMLGVPWDAILGHGAVSDPVARAMAAGALSRSNADIAVSVTGVAGPGGGTAEKPGGLVHFGAIRAGHERTAERPASRAAGAGIRRTSVLTALAMLASLPNARFAVELDCPGLEGRHHSTDRLGEQHPHGVLQEARAELELE